MNLLEEAKNSYDDFNGADGKIGDGDLGVTILHGLEEVNNNINKFSDDMGANFMLCSQAFVKKSGSSFGTLIAFSFMNISKNLKGKRENKLSVNSWRKIYNKVKNDCSKIHPNLPKIIEKNLDEIEKNWPKNIPSGIIHADLFPDNIFFNKDILRCLSLCI